MTQPTIRVTFDTNVLRAIVRPGDANPTEAELNALIQQGDIVPLVSATCFNLEGILKVDRSGFMRDRDVIMTNDVREDTLDSRPPEDGQNPTVKMRFSISPDHTTHPGMSPVHAEFLEEAIALGFLLIHIPLIGMPTAEGLRYSDHPDRYDNLTHFHPMNNLGGAIRESLVARGAGYAHVIRLFDRIEKRAKRPFNRQDIFNPDLFNADEQKELAAAIGEWSDGDSVAAHVRHAGSIFCTRDFARKAGSNSVFSTANRQWLADRYAVSFKTPEQVLESFERNQLAFH